MSARYGTVEDRFWANVVPEPNSGCWLWDGPVDDFGYGRFRVDGRKERAHRLSFRMHCEPVPVGKILLHSCDVPGCVNPAHLRIGVDADNVQDKVKRGRQARGESAASAKLSEATVHAIRRASGTQRGIAEMYGVSHNIVGRIRRRQLWKHV